MGAKKVDRQFMELAVNEMVKSRAEHERKIDPMVGAVLVSKNGELLGSAYRGALRTGDHAEYTLIERKLRDRDLEGSTLYVTLEPCTKRNPPKRPCVELIKSSRIGKVFIGITDPNPNITGKGISYLMNNRIEVEFFDLNLIEVIRDVNHDFITYFEDTGQVAVTERDFEGSSDKEKEPVPAATVSDLSSEMINKYLQSRNSTYKVPSQELWEFMYKNGFLIKETEGDYTPTVAGILLFGKTPEDFLTQSKVLFEAHVGDKIVQDDFTGPLIGLRDKIDEFFRKYMRSFTEIREFERKIVYEYPIEALREAVFNAIVHRDYREGAKVLIYLLRDKVIVKSPGHLLRPLTLDRMRAFNAPPYSRNPRIALTYRHMTWIEERGTGMKKMRDLLTERGLRPPMFDIDAGYFVVSFLGQEYAWSNVIIAPSFLNKLDVLDRKIVCFIMEKGRVTTKECAKKFKVNVATARRHLGKLKGREIVESHGGGRKIHYVLKGT